MKWYLLRVLCLGPQEDTWSLMTMPWQTCVLLSVNSRERLVPSGAVNAQFLYIFPLSFAYKHTNYSLLAWAHTPRKEWGSWKSICTIDLKRLWKSSQVHKGISQKPVLFLQAAVAMETWQECPSAQKPTRVWCVKCSNKTQHLAWLHQVPIKGP